MKKRIRRTKEEARRLILDETEAHVREHGPDGFRVTEVAKSLGMHQTNIFHHFGSREGLLRALAERAIQDGAARVVQALREPMGDQEADRAEALARVFDVIQRDGVGRLYGWLILSGLLDEGQAPELSGLVGAFGSWQDQAWGPSDARSEDDLRSLVLLLSIYWLGEAVGGPVLAQSVGCEGDPEVAVHRHHRWMAQVLVRWMATPRTETG